MTALKALLAVLGILALLLLVLAGLVGGPAHAQETVTANPVTSDQLTSDQWVALVTTLRAYDHLLDNDDRKFLFRMTNVLTAHDDALPDAAQRKWILDIEKRIRPGR